MFFGDDVRGWPRCKRRLRRFFTCYVCCHPPSALPLNRDDIFYSHSLYLLPQYKSNVLFQQQEAKDRSKKKDKQKKMDKLRGSVSYHMSVTRINIAKDQRPKCSGPCVQSIRTMLDCSLMKLPSFVVFMICGLFSYVGMIIPLLYIKERATHHNIESLHASYLISTIGLFNSIGRISSGALPSITKNLKVIPYTYAMILISGICTCVSGLNVFMKLQYQITYAGIFGFCGACLATLRTIIVVELYGLEQLTNAVGLQMTCYGLGTCLGTILGGLFCDFEGGFNYCFYFAGVCLLLSGFFLVPLKKIRVWELQKQETKDLNKVHPENEQGKMLKKDLNEERKKDLNKARVDKKSHNGSKKDVNKKET